MNKKAKKIIKSIIDDNRDKIGKKESKDFLKANPNFLEEEKENAKILITQKLDLMDNYYKELLPFIKNLRVQVRDIKEETHICAIYLLLSYTSREWKSFFELSKSGDSNSWVFIRLIKEALALVELFVLDSQKDEFKNIKKWFSGQIVSHSVFRETQEKRFKELGFTEDIKEMNTIIYQSESLAIHRSYPTILESISPFVEDFDYEGNTQYVRVSKMLSYAKGSMNTMAITLKSVYGSIEKNEEYKALDEILEKYKTC